MTTFSYILEFSGATVTTASSETTGLRQMVELARALAAALDGVAAEIAEASGLEPDSDTITDAVFNCTDVDQAMALLTGDQPQERVQ